MRLIILILTMLTGCTLPSVVPTKLDTTPKILVVITEDFGPLRKKYKNKRLQGLTEFLINGTCKIYIPPLKNIYDEKAMCIAGHELWHCIIGTFHKLDEGNSC